MDKQKKKRAIVLNLGAASIATKGNWGPYSDDIIMQQMAGLSND